MRCCCQQLLFVMLSAVMIHIAGAQTLESHRVWFSLGPESWDGHVTYRIGDKIRQGPLVEYVHFPLSKLEWPVSATGLRFGGGLQKSNFRLVADAAFLQADDAGKMKDWDYEWDFAPQLVTTYSESTAEFDAWEGHCALQYDRPIMPAETTTLLIFRPAVGLIYQSMNWAAGDALQWYPVDPSIPADRFGGVGVKYELELWMPYIGGGLIAGGCPFSAGIEFGWSPWLWARDEDDHLWRYILAKTDAEGDGWWGSCFIQYCSTRGLLLRVQLSITEFEAKGTEQDYVYDGPEAGERWEIDHKINGSIKKATASLGFSF